MLTHCLNNLFVDVYFEGQLRGTKNGIFSTRPNQSIAW